MFAFLWLLCAVAWHEPLIQNRFWQKKMVLVSVYCQKNMEKQKTRVSIVPEPCREFSKDQINGPLLDCACKSQPHNE
jgi:hypothetical protein